MLADHGYGELLFDLRAHGESGGDFFAFGWDADQDMSAALAYLQNRSGVGPNRIGVLGLSIGAEVVMQGAANINEVEAVVAEGSGYRMVEEWLLAPEAPGKILTPGQWIFSQLVSYYLVFLK
jgi:alpha/beta superfamily hydrolase